MFLYATLNPSRNGIVDDSIMGKQTSIYIPLTIVHCIAVARQNVHNFDAVLNLLT
jgi:hypothetical protein